jgi:hypothetical protein
MMQFRAVLLIACAAMSVSSCGGGGGHDGGGSPRPAITTQIISDPVYDGDIQEISPATFVVTQGMTASVQSVFAGIDPVTLTEYRAFLDFPLTGATGIPTNAMIESASLDIYINNILPANGTLPILIELVSVPPPLIPSDFDRTAQPPLAFTRVAPPFNGSDIGTNVSIDITSLVVHAQLLGLNDFQVRIMEDLGPAIPVLMEINDTTGPDRARHGPLLTVTYF